MGSIQYIPSIDPYVTFTLFHSGNNVLNKWDDVLLVNWDSHFSHFTGENK